MTQPIAIISAADANFFDLLRGLVCSIRDKPKGRSVDLYVFDLGLSAPQRDWLTVQGVILRAPRWSFDVDVPLFIQAFVERSRIPEYFTGHEVYLWIDADAWVQTWDAVETFVDGARRYGFAAVAEDDRSYDRLGIYNTHRAAFAELGVDVRAAPRFQMPLNAGVFAGKAGAPHWHVWRGIIADNIDSLPKSKNLFLFDQTALSITLDYRGLDYARLPARYNWVACHALPKVDTDAKTLLEPNMPHLPLGVIHAAHATKRAFFTLDCIGGGRLARTIGYQGPGMIPAGDYVSPGLSLTFPDAAFPNITLGDREPNTWPYLRKTIPHNWYVDRRIPNWGFSSRDEAHILYNTALRFRGKPALEIGCLMGWSACHIAMGGVDLDVIDPLLKDPQVCASVSASLEACKLSGRILLAAGLSPSAVDELATTRGNWSLFFIDGDHEGDAPLNDTIACERHAAADAAMLFHDLTSPHVAAGLFYLQGRGWNVRIYHTAQIMGIAWRGDVEPIEHSPDPRVAWTVPEHLMALLQGPAPAFREEDAPEEPVSD